MWWTPDKQAYAVNYLIGAGLSPWGAAGLVSRWVNVESGTQGPFSQGGYKGRAFGIAQWLGPRLPPIAGDTNFDDQLAYVVTELNGIESRAGNVLRTAQDDWTGAVGASMYERASGYDQSTGEDDYTEATRAGAATVLQNANLSASVSPTLQPQPALTQSVFPDASTLGIGGSVAVGVVALLALWFLVDW